MIQVSDLGTVSPTGLVDMLGRAPEKSKCLGVLFFPPAGPYRICPENGALLFFMKNLRILKHIGNAGSIITSALRVASSPSARPVAARAWRCWLACGPASGLLAAQHPQRSASKGAAAALGLGVGARGEAWHFGAVVSKKHWKCKAKIFWSRAQFLALRAERPIFSTNPT